MLARRASRSTHATLQVDHERAGASELLDIGRA